METNESTNAEIATQVNPQQWFTSALIAEQSGNCGRVSFLGPISVTGCNYSWFFAVILDVLP